MNDHDIIEVTSLSHDGVQLTCGCGARFVGVTHEKASEAHERHFGLENARAALRKEGDGS